MIRRDAAEPAPMTHEKASCSYDVILCVIIKSNFKGYANIWIDATEVNNVIWYFVTRPGAKDT